MAKNEFFMYKNKPLVRCGDVLYYGNMTDPYVVRIKIKTKKKVHVIGQDESTCTVYGMPKAVATAGLVDQVVKLDNIAQEIIMHVGVN